MSAEQSTIYKIVIQAPLEPGWSIWFDGMIMTSGLDGTTILSGPIVDQAALHGLLAQIRDLNLPLLAIYTVPQQMDFLIEEIESRDDHT
jgi:hypothetical protein